MSSAQRWSALLESLAVSGRLSVEAAAKRFEVSEATIRRDFDELARQQLLVRTWGGAMVNRTAYELPLRYKASSHADAKQRIAAAAAALVHPGAIVALNGGTTTTEVARSLATRSDLQGGHGDPSITVVTNAVNIANELAVRPQLKLVVTGGVARAQTYELSGPLALTLLDGLSLDFAFLGVDGLDLEMGATTHNENEAGVNHLMAERAGQVVVVADGSKLGVQAFARICTVQELDVVVTEREASPELVSALGDRGVRVIAV